MLHLLLHMAEATEPLTSERLAGFLGTNPVVVRRTMAELRSAGIVVSEKGHGGGWRLDRPLDRVTLADVHAALGSPGLLAFGLRNPDATCLVERAVNGRLLGAMEDARRVLLDRLASITLADVAAELPRRHGHTHSHAHGENSHA